MNKKKELAPKKEKDQPVYEAPSVKTYTDADILEKLGPAQAGATYNPF